MAYKQSTADLRKHFDQQLKFLRTSTENFDKGDEDEAIRIALILRILLHDTPKSSSLMGLLTLKNQIGYYSAVSPYMPTNMVTYAGLCGYRIDKQHGEYFPSFTTGSGLDKKYLNFDYWWNEIIFDDKKALFSRKKIIKMLANKDGGAHIAADIPEDYYALTKLNSLGNIFSFQDDQGNYKEVAMRNNPAYVSVRAIADEFLCSLSINDNYTLYNRRKHTEIDVGCRMIGDSNYLAVYKKDLRTIAEKFYTDSRVIHEKECTVYYDILCHKIKSTMMPRIMVV